MEREKRKVAAVSRFDSAMFPDSSRGTKGETIERKRDGLLLGVSRQKEIEREEEGNGGQD